MGLAMTNPASVVQENQAQIHRQLHIRAGPVDTRIKGADDDRLYYPAYFRVPQADLQGIQVGFPGLDHLLPRLQKVVNRNRLPTRFIQHPHSGPLEQGVDNPGLAPGLVVHIVKRFPSDLLAGLPGPLGKQPGDVLPPEVGKRRGICFYTALGNKTSHINQPE
jgi:hypothetical protein